MAINKRGAKEKALVNLEKQLLSGTKPERVEGKTISNRIPLTDFDKTRINKEIQFLNKKLG